MCTAWKARAVQCSKELAASDGHTFVGTHASLPVKLHRGPKATDWLSRCCETVKAQPIFWAHTYSRVAFAKPVEA